MRSIAPVEYVVIAFPGNQFTGGIAPAIADLVESGTVRIIDLLFILKDEDGNVTSFEYDDLPEILDAFADIDGEADGFLSDDDILAAAEDLELNSSALLMVWEDLWAARLKDEILAAGGQLVAGSRIPHEVVEELLDLIDLAAAEGSE
jgi:Family of unknown function (DUF6325)